MTPAEAVEYWASEAAAAVAYRDEAIVAMRAEGARTQRNSRELLDVLEERMPMLWTVREAGQDEQRRVVRTVQLGPSSLQSHDLGLLRRT